MESIFRRKEEERLANNGLFLWGIGNAVGPSIEELVRRTPEPEVLFSPIKSSPRRSDVCPENVAVWTRAECVDGTPFELPRCTLVTSRQGQVKAKAAHYALVCHSPVSLTKASDDEPVSIDALQNLLSGRRVGASQVTAVVALRRGATDTAAPYAVALRARLIWPYFLRLTDPVPAQEDDSLSDWNSAIRTMWTAVLDRDGRRAARAEAIQ